MGRVQKIYPKGKTWWRHGKHKGMPGISCLVNRQIQQKQKRRRIKEILDLSKPDWSVQRDKC